MERNGASASRSRTIMNDHVNTSDHVFTNQESDLQIIPRPEVPDLKITVKSFKYQKSEFRTSAQNSLRFHRVRNLCSKIFWIFEREHY